MMENGRGLIKALENWAKKVTSGYKDVEVRDLSTSFRDGLAFCAIVHHYRPDLINFDSLSKENIYENNSLAFSVAEKQLGVPALLDAEDMVRYSHPDRLSIITYLSQLRNCFENQNKVSKKPDLKRIQSSSSGPPAKVVPASLVSSKRHEVCQVCQHRVFILERLIVDGKLYHTTCFRCHKCNALLNPGAYVEGDATGLYECTVCVVDEHPESNDATTMEDSEEVDHPSPKVIQPPVKDLRSKESILFAKSNLWQEESDSNSPDSESKGRSESSVSVKDKINVFEKNLKKPKSPLPSPILSIPVPRPRQSLLLSQSAEARSPDGGKEIDTRKREETCSPTIPYAISPVKNSELPSPLREKNGKTLFPAGGDSPRMPRDIFKSSLSPLKLNLPSSTRKDPERSFNISPISSLHSTTLPRSVLKQPDKKIKDLEFGSNTQLLNDSKVARRSSLESSYEVNKEDKTSTETVPFSRTHSSQEISAGPITYTAVYKSIYNASSPTNNISAQKLTFRHSYIDPKSSYELESSEKELNKRSESFCLEKSSRVGPEGFSKSVKIQDKTAEPEKDVDSATVSSPVVDVPQREVDTSALSNGKSVDNPNKTAEPERAVDSAMVSSPVSEKSNVELSPLPSSIAKEEEQYPDDLNPFGEDEGGEEEYPDNLNPFGDDEEQGTNNSSTAADYDESKNPFASDDDDDASVNLTEGKTTLDSIYSNVSSPSGSLKGTLKKRRAPKPPTPRAVDVFPKDSAADSGVESSFSSPSLSKKNFHTSSPRVRKSKPAPPPPPQDTAASAKKGKESDNMKLRMQPKKKKRPAPSVPIPARKDMRKIPLKEILREMKEIEEKQREYERQGREIEILIRDRDKDEEPSVEEEEYIMQLFELVNQKNALFRRQAELMYIKRSQRLEELQHQVEQEIRQLMEKPESDKTESDRQKEEELTMELLDIVDQRNSIIDSIEMDRRRELEEDHSVQEQLEIKNGDLPITAEIKQKSGKAKKKAKKEKKKKDEELGKKKKHLFSKR